MPASRRPEGPRAFLDGNAPMIAVNGFQIHKGWLDPAAQAAMAADIAAVAEAAPFFAPLTPWGKPMSVRMTSAGRYGWFTDRKRLPLHRPPPLGRALAADPAPRCSRSGARWSRTARDPDCCLVNHYAATARMGLHRDADEEDFSWPVLSISLGDRALFRMGGPAPQGPDHLDPARKRRRRGLRRPGPARLPRHRPHPLRLLAPAARGRADQPDPAGGRLSCWARP